MSSRWNIFFDLITVLMLIGSMLVLAGTFLIISNPDVPFNPFPLPTLPAVLQMPSPTLTSTPTATFTLTYTPTFTPIPPTLTPSITPTVTFTPSQTPTITPSPTPVLAGLPSLTPTQPPPPTIIAPFPTIPAALASTPDSGATFAFTAREPVFQRNLNAQDCAWSSIAGSVTGLLGEPVVNLAVEVTGERFDEVRFTGTALEFGQAGFEFELDDTPRSARYTVRLLGTTGEPLSDAVAITTRDDCDSNVIVLQFVQVREY